jgi:hypothetical protein
VGTLSSTAIEIIDMYKFAVAQEKVLWHLEARFLVGCGILHSKASISLLLVQYLEKDTCITKN